MRIKNWVATSIIILVLMQNRVAAQNFATGDIAFSAGYGFPNLTKTVFNVAEGDNINSIFIGPVYGKAEFALNETVGFGVNFAYAMGSATYETQDNEIDSLFYNTNFKYTSYSILARFNFHFGNNPMFDPYAGFGMGYRNANYKYTGGDPDETPADINGFNHFGLDFTMGARLYLTENIAVYGEVGIAKSPIQVGLVVKL